MNPDAGSQESNPKLDETATPAVAEQTSSPDVTEGASSSDAAANEQDRSIADAIRDEFVTKYGEEKDEAAETAKPDPKPEATAEQKETPEPEKDDSEDKSRLSDDDFKALPEGARHRIGELNARAKKAERLLQERETELSVTRKSHEGLTELQSFVTKNGIDSENVTLAFDMMAKFSRGDYAGFIEAIQPTLDFAMQAAGKAIAPDLRAKVEDGYLTEDVAQELTASRIKAQAAEGRAKRVEGQFQERQRAEATEAATAGIVNAVNRREAELKATDPLYAQKSQAVRKYMTTALERLKEAGGSLRNEQAAINLVNDAYAYASESMKATEPPRQATPRMPSASIPPRGGPTPATTKDAMIDALDGYRSAASR